MNGKIRDKLSVLTASPGVYIMKNAQDEIIYIGKAKNLKNRVSQYFTAGSSHTAKVRQMVSHVDYFEYIVTGSELEALILENNLIKQHKPKYNILLKDDKTYPYIAVSKTAEYPRFTLSRQRKDAGTRYFGPFQSSKAVYDIIDTVNSVFGLYSCKHIFPRDIGKFRPCLNYHIGKCTGICTGKVSADEYKTRIHQATAFLNGDYKRVKNELETQMKNLSDNMEYEKAAAVRDRLRNIEKLEAKQVIVFSPSVNRDIIAYSELEGEVCFSVMHIRRGKLLYQDTHFLTDVPDDIMNVFIERYYQQADIIPGEIAPSVMPSDAELLAQWLSAKRGGAVRIIEAQKGENVRLIDMCRKNALEKLAEKKASGVRSSKLMAQVAQMLGIKTTPSRIEMYDVSHFGGDSIVGGMIVWQDGRFKKSEYKRFAFDDILPDDYKHTHEMIERRLRHLKDGSAGFEKKPNIILLDGGVGHLNAVYETVSSYGIAVFGLVKDRHHRTRALVGVNGEVDIRINPSVFRLFTSLQDEVHRFAISYMHNKKSKEMVSGGLMSIPGVGKTRYKALMDVFGTVDAIKHASAEQIAAVKGITLPIAKEIYKSLSEERT